MFWDLKVKLWAKLLIHYMNVLVKMNLATFKIVSEQGSLNRVVKIFEILVLIICNSFHSFRGKQHRVTIFGMSFTTKKLL